jgi:hypothetical protein
MKPTLATLILTELALAVLLVVFAFGHVDSPSLARAWLEYREHPSLETEAAFKQKKTAMDKTTFVLTAGAGLLLAVNSYALFKINRKVSAGSQPDIKPRPF